MRRRLLLLLGLALIGAGAGLLWRRPQPAPPPPPRPAAALPLARPGPAWGLVQQRLAAGLDGLDLPAKGVQVDLVVETDTNGQMTVTDARIAGTSAPAAVTARLVAATRQVPFALAGPAGRYRLWLKLKPAPAGQGEE